MNCQEFAFYAPPFASRCASEGELVFGPTHNSLKLLDGTEGVNRPPSPLRAIQYASTIPAPRPVERAPEMRIDVVGGGGKSTWPAAIVTRM